MEIMLSPGQRLNAQPGAIESGKRHSGSVLVQWKHPKATRVALGGMLSRPPESMTRSQVRGGPRKHGTPGTMLAPAFLIKQKAKEARAAAILGNDNVRAGPHKAVALPGIDAAA